MAQAEQFFQAMQQAWQQAALHMPPSQHFYRIGGLVVQLQIVGADLAARLTPALAHLAIPSPTVPLLTILLWDVSTTSIPFPSLPWQEEDYCNRSEVRGFQEGRFLATYQLDSYSVSLFDRQTRLGLYAVPTVNQLLYYEDGMPLRRILHWGLRDQRRQFVHAAAVGTEHGGVLIVGKSGSGKSTTALASLLAGMRYVADDYCCVAFEPETVVYSLYNSGKVVADHLCHFPTLAPLVKNPNGLAQGEKALLLLQQHFPEQVIASLSLQAILLPTITEQRDTSLVAASKGEALRAIAPSTILQLSNGGEDDFRLLARLVTQLPTYWLKLGTELTQIPKTIQQLLSTKPIQQSNQNKPI